MKRARFSKRVARRKHFPGKQVSPTFQTSHLIFTDEFPKFIITIWTCFGVSPMRLSFSLSFTGRAVLPLIVPPAVLPDKPPTSIILRFFQHHMNFLEENFHCKMNCNCISYMHIHGQKYIAQHECLLRQSRIYKGRNPPGSRFQWKRNIIIFQELMRINETKRGTKQIESNQNSDWDGKKSNNLNSNSIIHRLTQQNYKQQKICQTVKATKFSQDKLTEQTKTDNMGRWHGQILPHSHSWDR